MDTKDTRKRTNDQSRTKVHEGKVFPGLVYTTGLLLFCSLVLVHLNARAPQRGDSGKAAVVESPAAAVVTTLPVDPVLHEARRFTALPGTTDGSQPDGVWSASLLQSYGKLPLSFEPNQGQTDQAVKFLSRGKGYTLFLTAGEAVLALHGEQEAPGRNTVLRMQLVGAERGMAVVGREELPGKSNYFIGNDPRKWRTNVPNYGRVSYEGVYPGVDLLYYGRQGELETDFVVEAGGDPGRIRLRMSGADRMRINKQGDLEMEVDGKQVVLEKPLAYQQGSGAGSEGEEKEKEVVAVRFVQKGPETVGFEVGEYNRRKPVVIDPVVLYSSYLGGSGYDVGEGIAVDTAGNAYVTGITHSSNFPTANPLQTTDYGCFVAKLNSAGDALVYSTYLGGSGLNEGHSIAADAAGNAYVTGVTYSSDFPLVNPLPREFPLGWEQGDSEGFVAKLNPTGNALVYSTYLGGPGVGEGPGGVNLAIPYEAYGSGIAVDGDGNAYVTGATTAGLRTEDPLQATYGGGSYDAFVAKIDAAGSALVYCTYLGGSGDDEAASIAVDAAGNAYVTGFTNSTNFPLANPLQSTYGGGIYDAFVAKIDASGSALVYSTFLGGNNGDWGYGVAADAAGNAYVTGYTWSTNFPTKNPVQGFVYSFDGFVTKLTPTGNAMVYSTYLGGDDTSGLGIAVDSAGNAYVAGYTNSPNFPMKNPVQLNSSLAYYSFVTKVNATGLAFMFSSYLGGSDANTADTDGYGIAVDAKGNIYITGQTYSNSFLTRNPLQSSCGSCPSSSNAFIAKVFVPATVGDFFADGEAHIAVWRPSNGTWYVLPGTTTSDPLVQQWGETGDIPVPGDYDGDGKTDFAVWRPASGTWYILPSSNPSSPIVRQWGETGDIPVPSDYDGDGKTDFAVWRPASGTWYILPSSNPSSPIVQHWGESGDVPVPGDYDGDGKTDFAVWRPANGTWYIIPSSSPGTPMAQQWGETADIPVPGDYDGTGKTNIGVWRPSDGSWYIIPSSTPMTFTVTPWGIDGDAPVQQPVGR